MDSISLKFLMICIPLRISLAIGLLYLPEKYTPLVGILSALIGLMFLIKFLLYTEKQVGAFGQNVWWNNNRFIHSILLFLLAYLIYRKDPIYKFILFFDVSIGILLTVFR
jgi:hypothetical protein